MSNYRVGKSPHGTLETFDYKYFPDEKEAENYATTTSLHDDRHIYIVERKINGDDYMTTKHFIRGQVTMIFE